MNGNLTNWITHTSDVVYVYDMENRLKQVVRNGETVLECWYDGQSRRIAKKEIVDNSTNYYQYVYDGWTVLAVLNKDGKMLEYYSRGIGLAGDIGTIVAATHTSHSTTNGTFYYHSNHRGDVTSVRSETNTVATYAYRPFGELKSSTGPYAARYGFSSKEYDPSTCFNYYFNRYYSPNLQQWLSNDPAMELYGGHLRKFCHNNPIIFIDLHGMEPIDSGNGRNRPPSRITFPIPPKRKPKPIIPQPKPIEGKHFSSYLQCYIYCMLANNAPKPENLLECITLADSSGVSSIPTISTSGFDCASDCKDNIYGNDPGSPDPDIIITY